MGLSLTSYLGTNTRDNGISGLTVEPAYSFRMLKSSSDHILLGIILIWNIGSPSFRVTNFVIGHKKSLISYLLLTSSFLGSLFATLFVTTLYGCIHISLTLVPILLPGLVILLTKMAVDSGFKQWSKTDKIVYSLMAAIFPITTPRGKLDETLPEDAYARRLKNSKSELTFLYLLQITSGLFLTAVLLVLKEFTTTLPTLLQTFDSRDGLLSIFSPIVLALLGFSFCILVSILARLLYNRFSSWVFIRKPGEGPCCPPLPRKVEENIIVTGVDCERDRTAPPRELEKIFQQVDLMKNCE